MTTKLTEKMMQLGINKTICDWFQFFAQETWDRIGYARTRKGLKIWETTITQNLIFEFHTSKDLYSPISPNTWGIEILESINESTNGNDIELFVETNDGILFFAVQAKIINHKGFKRNGMIDGNYPNINHTVAGLNQIDLLCSYASNKGGIPIYLLYNFVKNSFENKRQCNIDFEIEQYGCSISNANHIKDNYFKNAIWSIPTFLNLHPNNALPWFVIPCCFQKMSKSDILKLLGETEIDISKIKEYDLYEIRTDKNWKSLEPFKTTEKKTSKTKNNWIEFNPKYRVVISSELSYKKK